MNLTDFTIGSEWAAQLCKKRTESHLLTTNTHARVYMMIMLGCDNRVDRESERERYLYITCCCKTPNLNVRVCSVVK